MNVAGSKLSLITVAAAAIALGTVVAATSPVLAREPGIPAPIARVSYSDLNLGTAAGVARLNARLHAASEALCPSAGVETLDSRLDVMACRDRILAVAAPQVRRAIERFAEARAGATLALAK